MYNNRVLKTGAVQILSKKNTYFTFQNKRFIDKHYVLIS